jgi:hypothetical protein
MAARFLQHLRIFVDLAAHDRAKSRHQVAAQAPAADDNAEALSDHADGSMAGHVLGCNDDQWCLPFSIGLRSSPARDCNMRPRRFARRRANQFPAFPQAAPRSGIFNATMSCAEKLIS